jgi:hypothetical protein
VTTKKTVPVLTKAGVLDFKNDERAYTEYERETIRMVLEFLIEEKTST